MDANNNDVSDNKTVKDEMPSLSLLSTITSCSSNINYSNRNVPDNSVRKIHLNSSNSSLKFDSCRSKVFKVSETDYSIRQDFYQDNDSEFHSTYYCESYIYPKPARKERKMVLSSLSNSELNNSRIQLRKEGSKHNAKIALYER